jgi:hypothetical protein
MKYILFASILIGLSACSKESKNNKDFAVGKYSGIINIQINKTATTTNKSEPSYGKTSNENINQIMEVNITDSNSITYINGFPMSGGPNTYNFSGSTNTKLLPAGIYLLNKNERTIEYSYNYKGIQYLDLGGFRNTFEFEVTETRKGTLK